MDSGVGKLLAELGDQNMHLFGLPTQDRGVEAHGDSLQSVFELDQIPRADGFLSSFLAIADVFKGESSSTCKERQSLTRCLSFGQGPTGQRIFSDRMF